MARLLILPVIFLMKCIFNILCFCQRNMDAFWMLCRRAEPLYPYSLCAILKIAARLGSCLSFDRGALLLLQPLPSFGLDVSHRTHLMPNDGKCSPSSFIWLSCYPAFACVVCLFLLSCSGVSFSGDIQDPPGQDPVQPTVGDPASAGGLD